MIRASCSPRLCRPSDSLWPNAPEELVEVFNANSVSDEHARKMTHENAMRWYSFDPFAIRPKEQCTVKALRAESPGHDVSIKAMSKGRYDDRSKGADLAELAANATA